MQRVGLICTGRLRESFYIDACAEYEKRLGRYCSLEIAELTETGNVERDGEAMLRRIPDDAWAVALCVEGTMLSSEELSERMARWALEGKSRLVFLIGGSDGLSGAVKRRADLRLSMSPMTFPHHLARVMVLEQLYRAYNIMQGGKYHK